jgi:hypothetical protein
MSACARADFATASAWVDEAFDIGVSVDTPVALMPWMARANVLLGDGRFDEALECMASAIAFFDAGGSAFQRSNVRGASAHYLVAFGDVASALTIAEESLVSAREIGNPTQLAIALGALGDALTFSDPRRALDALEESLALTDAGASDVVRPIALMHVATLRAELGDARGTLECLRDGIERAVEWGDRSAFGAIGFGVIPLVQIGRPELALTVSAASTFTTPLGGYWRDAQQEAIARARGEVGAECADALTARIESMSYDEMTEHLRAEVDLAIESTSAS